MQERLFRNREEYVVGVVKFNHKNEPKGVPVDPGQSVWLNESEMKLTANAPATAAENPFTKGSLEEIDPGARSTDTVQDRPVPGPSEFDPIDLPEETGTDVSPAQPPVFGSAAAGEEVATPEAQQPDATGNATGQTEAPTPVEGSEQPEEKPDESEGKVIPPEDKAATAKAKADEARRASQTKDQGKGK